ESTLINQSTPRCPFRSDSTLTQSRPMVVLAFRAVSNPALLKPDRETILALRFRGSPWSAEPESRQAASPEFRGHVLVYAEMVRGSETCYVWFALPDSILLDSHLPTPDAYNNTRWIMDYGFGRYTSGGPYMSQARNIYATTFVCDNRATDGTRGNRI